MEEKATIDMPNLLMVRMKPWINWVSTSNNEA
jgi:hypothetical protein